MKKSINSCRTRLLTMGAFAVATLLSSNAAIADFSHPIPPDPVNIPIPPVRPGPPDLSVSISASPNGIQGVDVDDQVTNGIVALSIVKIDVQNLITFTQIAPGLKGSRFGSDVPQAVVDIKMGRGVLEQIGGIQVSPGFNCMPATMPTAKTVHCEGGPLLAGNSFQIAFTVLASQACRQQQSDPVPSDSVNVQVKALDPNTMNVISEVSNVNNSATSEIEIYSLC
jgi:hypothetical protein